MVVLPVNFEVPADIAARLTSGELIQFGGVVRNAAGHIVKHLKPVTLVDDASRGSHQLLSALKNPWVIGAVGLGLLVGAGLGAGILAHGNAKVVDRLGRYEESIRTYVRGIQHGELSADVLDRLIADLDAVDELVSTSKVEVESDDQTDALLTAAIEYTARLAEANAIDPETLPAPPSSGHFTELRAQLAAQREIFRRAA